jgi:hypothetical protein
MSSTSYNGDRLPRPFPDDLGAIKSLPSYSLDPTSTRSEIKQGRNCLHCKHQDSEIFQPTSFANWRGGSHISKRCREIRIEGKAREEHLEVPQDVDKARMWGYQMARVMVASFLLQGRIQPVCQFHLKVVGVVREEVRMNPYAVRPLVASHNLTTRQVHPMENMEDRCRSNSRAIP